MSGNKHFFALLLFGGLLPAGCVPRPALIDPDRPNGALPPNFFKNIPAVVLINQRGLKITGINDTVETYVARFSERYIEKDDLLTYSNLSDASGYPRVTYDDMQRYSQALFLYHLRTTPQAIDVVAYLAVHYNANGKCIGLGPAYLGTVDKGEGHIDFLYQMKVTIDGRDTCLAPVAKLSRLRSLACQYRSDTHLLFLAKELAIHDPQETWWQPNAAPSIRVTKIVDYDANKIGGVQPLVFNIRGTLPGEQFLQFNSVK
ncbi:hypothetical protein [Puia dinghuensis]|uniref:Uncharacterized protein n=1 Tax=Puia dinghuensis TaxID=1792502 RepID=A0A8J2UIN3_9BACT|nr:hypothetical protein [Puia dinghuensis]GGB23271.1 hypothetical protein GCM10011511_53970 [Puia dinghuensis]